MLAFVLVCISLCPFYAINLGEAERAGCFTFIVFLMSCYCNCFVVLAHGSVDRSAVCDFGIS